jgi:hypothetical protein
MRTGLDDVLAGVDETGPGELAAVEALPVEVGFSRILIVVLHGLLHCRPAIKLLIIQLTHGVGGWLLGGDFALIIIE